MDMRLTMRRTPRICPWRNGPNETDYCDHPKGKGGYWCVNQIQVTGCPLDCVEPKGRGLNNWKEDLP